MCKMFDVFVQAGDHLQPLHFSLKVDHVDGLCTSCHYSSVGFRVSGLGFRV